MPRGWLPRRRTENQQYEKLWRRSGPNSSTSNYTTGDADFLSVVDAEDTESVIAGLLAAAAAGMIADISTARAWTGAEFKAVAEKASKAAKAYRTPGKH
jgi:hypothetical protein